MEKNSYTQARINMTIADEAMSKAKKKYGIMRRQSLINFCVEKLYAGELELDLDYTDDGNYQLYTMKKITQLEKDYPALSRSGIINSLFNSFIKQY